MVSIFGNEINVSCMWINHVTLYSKHRRLLKIRMIPEWNDRFYSRETLSKENLCFGQTKKDRSIVQQVSSHYNLNFFINLLHTIDFLISRTTRNTLIKYKIHNLRSTRYQFCSTQNNYLKKWDEFKVCGSVPKESGAISGDRTTEEG